MTCQIRGRTILPERLRHKAAIPGVAVEVLTPDFQGRADCIKTVLDAEPVVSITISRLYRDFIRKVRPGSKYDRSMHVLHTAKKLNAAIPTKSGLMLGLGESFDEVKEVLSDLRKIDAISSRSVNT